MNKELALRTFAYLIRHYKTHNATIINKQEIEAIEFILNDNEFLEQQLHDASIQIQELIEKDIWCPSNCEKLEKLQQENKRQKEVINKAIEYIRNHQLVFRDHTTEEIDKWFNQFYIDLLDILKEVG